MQAYCHVAGLTSRIYPVTDRDTGKGNQEMGAPNLSDKVWLYGSDKAAVMERITIGGGGVMPAWSNRLDAATMKSLAVYVHTLGGGK